MSITFDQALAQARAYIERNEPLTDETDDERLLLHAVCAFLRHNGATREEVNAFIDLKATVEIAAYQRGWDRGYDAGQPQPRIA